MEHTMLQIDGNRYERKGLASMAYRIIGSPTAPGWERDFFSFILHWLDDNDYIEQETSGTTGVKKLIRLPKKGMLYSAVQTCEFFKLGPMHRALLCLPVKYIAGKMMVVRAFYSGMNLIITPPGGNPLEGHEEPFDFAAMVPMQVMNSLATSPRLSTVKKLIIGGGEISPLLDHQLQDAETDVYATYGMTETASHVALRKVNGTDRSPWFK
ncbi:MAG TPA: AMP-binding protein, partial [Bacteroidales bacterium]|nr:AMP-binding protein [Bacteroidales bacterium]